MDVKLFELKYYMATLKVMSRFLWIIWTYITELYRVDRGCSGQSGCPTTVCYGNLVYIIDARYHSVFGH